MKQRLSEEDIARLEERTAELEGLASLVSFRPEVTLQAGPPDSPWSFNFVTAIVNAPVNDLLDRSMDYCRGLTMHEAAHATVTRIFDMVHPSLFQGRHVHALFNSIEDCRIETWIKDRNPGAAPWIRLYNDRLFAPIVNGRPIESWVTQYNMMILSRWWFGEDPKAVAPEVQDAFDRTWPAIQRAIAAQPPKIEINSPIVDDIYNNNRTLRLAYIQQDFVDPPSDFEKLVRIRQLQMVYIVVKEVLPVYEELNRKQQNSSQSQQDLQRFLEQMRAHHTTQQSGQRGSGQAAQGRPGQGQGGVGQQFTPGGGAGAGNVQDAIQQALNVNPRDQYLKVWQSLSAEIDLLSNQLIQVFHQRSRMKWLSGYESGARLDVRRAMAFEADPRLYRVLWQRKSTPKKIDPCFTLLLDRSGSMSGERIQGAFKGLVLLTEVCSRLSVPLNIVSFASDQTVEMTFDESLTEAKRMKLGTLMSRANNQTYMGAALRNLENILEETPASDKFLIVLSDGIPSDESETTNMVRRLSSKDVTCIGLGIGPETANLNRFFAEGMFDVTPTDVAEGFAQIIREKLL